MNDWQTSKVSPDRTHHTDANGAPFYTFRFHSVLPFHAPGLAPAENDEGAFHIGPDGKPAYPQRHRRTFGFYQGRAAACELRRGYRTV